MRFCSTTLGHWLWIMMLSRAAWCSTTSCWPLPRTGDFRPRACAPYRARTGKTENGVGYVKKNAVAGRCFATYETFEAHLDVWTREVADIRIHGTTGEVPIARFARAEAKALKPISGIPPFRATRELIRRVGSDCTVEIDGNAHWAIDPAYPDCRCRPHPSVNSSYRQRVDSGCRLTWDCNDCRGPLNRWRSILSSAHLLLTERHRCRTRFSAVLAAARVPLSSTIDLWNSSRGCVPTLRCEHS